MGLQHMTPIQRQALREREKRTYDDRGRSQITRDQVLADLHKQRAWLDAHPQWRTLVRA